jgi:GSH-dependent disulfide-bond oxidoreductase
MSDAAYTPPKVRTWNKDAVNRFSNINRPIAGPTHEKVLQVGKHPIQLYSLGTPNGVKVTVMLVELLALGHEGAEYDAWLININKGDQFSSGYVDINPNSKIPVMVDHSGPKPVRVFESGAILLYLAEKFGEFLPKEHVARTEALNWLFWQMGAAPFLGGGTAMRWKRSVSLTCLIADWPRRSILRATSTRSRIWRCGRGMARW